MHRLCHASKDFKVCVATGTSRSVTLSQRCRARRYVDIPSSLLTPSRSSCPPVNHVDIGQHSWNVLATAASFSTSVATNPKAKKPTLKTVLDRRRKVRQKQRRQQLKQERLQPPPPLDLNLHRRRDFNALFDQLAPTHSRTKLKESMKKIRSAMKSASIGPKSLSTILLDTLRATPPNDVANKTILEFLLSVAPTSPLQTKPPPPFPSQLNQLLLKARDRVREELVPWDDTGAIPSDERQLEADDEMEAQNVVEVLQANLPTKQLRSFIELLESFTGTSVTQGNHFEAKKGRYKIQTVRSHLKNRVGTHYHLVAPALADFFGYESHMIETDSKFILSHEMWKVFRQEFTAFLVQVQERLFEDQHGREIMESPSEPPMTIGDTVQLHPSSRLDAAKVVDRRFRRPRHVVMEAIQFQERTVTFTDGNQESDTGDATVSIPSNKLVFLDNLPIDITTESLMELYSRCGAIDQLQIFNQRPDLDPGPLNKTQMIARKRSRALGSSRLRKWQRPRSPVYALVSFQSLEGYQACVHDALRIFGMVIQKHPVRSIPCNEMKHLFLEGMDGLPCMELEYQLREHLSPDVFVCLATGQNNRAVVGSCEIRFSSFDAAFESYTKLQEIPLVTNQPDCSVHWMRTPNDALLWWSRKRGFD